MITHRGYTAEQVSNHHVWVSDSSGNAICHMSYTKKLSDEELRLAIDNFLDMLDTLDTSKDSDDVL